MSPARSPGSALTVAAFGTMLSLVAFTAPLSTLNATGLALGADIAARTWILSSMSIGLGAALLSTGTIADDFGRRRTFAAGTVVLAVASIIGAVASGPLEFVLARVAQGIGAGAVIASSLGIIAHAFAAGPARAKASGVWGASVGAGIAVGPLLSAGLEHVHSWRDAYWVMAAVAVGLAIAAFKLVEESRSDQPRGLDLWGAVTLAGGLSAFLAALVEGRSNWTQPIVLALFAVSALLLAAFVVIESRKAAPMLELSLLRTPAFAAATGAAFATGAGSIALFSYMSGFLGTALDISALGAALLLLGWSGTSIVTALLARRLPVRFSGRHQLAVGLLGVAIGQLTLTGVTIESTWLKFLPGLMFAGVFSGMVNAALGREAVASVPAGRGGMGSGANNTARYVGSAIGVTIVAVIAARPGGASAAEHTVALIHGWNLAVVVTAAISLIGAMVVLACRPRRRITPANSTPPDHTPSVTPPRSHPF